MMTVFIALDKCEKSNGCLQVLLSSTLNLLNIWITEILLKMTLNTIKPTNQLGTKDIAGNTWFSNSRKRYSDVKIKWGKNEPSNQFHKIAW